MQEGDVYLFQTDDNGDIEAVSGVVTMRPGLETSAYLSLFGGNEQDDGRADNPLQYWANYGQQEPGQQERSELQYLLRSIPSIPANLRRLEDAANSDLSWMLTQGLATGVSVTATMPGLNRVNILVEIEAQGTPSALNFAANWQASV